MEKKTAGVLALLIAVIAGFLLGALTSYLFLNSNMIDNCNNGTCPDCICNCNLTCSPCCPVIELDKEWKWTGDGTIVGGYLAMYLADSQGVKLAGTDWSTTGGAWDHTWTGLDHGTYQIFANYTITVNDQTLDTDGVYVQVDGNVLLECHKDVTNYLTKPTNGQAGEVTCWDCYGPINGTMHCTYNCSFIASSTYSCQGICWDTMMIP